jgi:hypothetical protein
MNLGQQLRTIVIEPIEDTLDEPMEDQEAGSAREPVREVVTLPHSV